MPHVLWTSASITVPRPHSLHWTPAAAFPMNLEGTRGLMGSPNSMAVLSVSFLPPTHVHAQGLKHTLARISPWLHASLWSSLRPTIGFSSVPTPPSCLWAMVVQKEGLQLLLQEDRQLCVQHNFLYHILGQPIFTVSLCGFGIPYTPSSGSIFEGVSREL